MTSRDLSPDEGPELLPPAELLRLRAELARPPADAVRAQHLAATTMAARQRGHRGMGRFASRGARAAVAIVASLAITSGLAGAQLLPDQAQRLLSNVSDRFAPSNDEPPADPAEPGDATTVRAAPREDRATSTADTPAGDPTTTTEAPVVVVDDLGTTTTSVLPSVTTTIPGPAGPGSPDDPTDPDATTTTTTAPPTTTTTEPPPTTTTTTRPSTTTTTGGSQP